MDMEKINRKIRMLNEDFNTTFYVLGNDVIESKCGQYKFTFKGIDVIAEYDLGGSEYKYEYTFFDILEIKQDFKKLINEYNSDYDCSPVYCELSQIFGELYDEDFEVEYISDSTYSYTYEAGGIPFFVYHDVFKEEFTLFYDNYNKHNMSFYSTADTLKQAIINVMNELDIDLQNKKSHIKEAQKFVKSVKKYIDQ